MHVPVGVRAGVIHQCSYGAERKVGGRDRGFAAADCSTSALCSAGSTRRRLDVFTRTPKYTHTHTHSHKKGALRPYFLLPTLLYVYVYVCVVLRVRFAEVCFVVS